MIKLILILVLTLSFNVFSKEDKKIESKESIISHIISSSNKKGVDPALSLAVATVESNFNPKAIRYEPKYATYSVGIFQLFYPTAKAMGFVGDIKKLQSPKVNIALGIEHLSMCYDPSKTIAQMACCYNAGVNVKESVCLKNKGIKKYVAKISKQYEIWYAILMYRLPFMDAHNDLVTLI